MCSVAGEMLAAYSPPSYYFPCRRAVRPVRQVTPTKPLPRPCLVISSPTTEETRTKKKVVFADDRGFSLTQVRMMSEPSNVPPSWSSQFISIITKDSTQKPTESWETTFPQPASDYIEFKRRLDEGNVSLENIFIKGSEEVAIGTVKVRNLSFEKEVAIRITYDNWKTYEDIQCTYVNNSLTSLSVTVLYDTFSFKITLRNDIRKVEFCVLYKSNGIEYWDNNLQRNYILLRKMVHTKNHYLKIEPITIPKDPQINRPCSEYTNWANVRSPYW